MNKTLKPIRAMVIVLLIFDRIKPKKMFPIVIKTTGIMGIINSKPEIVLFWVKESSTIKSELTKLPETSRHYPVKCVN